MTSNKIFISCFFLILLGFAFISCSNSSGIKQHEFKLSLQDIDGSIFIKNMLAVENICLDDSSMRVYAGDLNGMLYLLDGPDYTQLKVVNQFNKKGYFLGLDLGPDNNLYVAHCDYPDVEKWKEIGGSVYRADRDLESLTKISGNYAAINGLAVDNEGNLFFATSNFDFISPEGYVYWMDIRSNKEPELYLDAGGLANGLYFSETDNTFYLSNTLKGTFAFTSSSKELKQVYKGLKFMEAVDDLCSDSSGRIWMTDPGRSSIKCYDPAAGKLYRFVLEGIGQTSSCRIRNEQGRDILYIAELKTTQKMTGGDYDGRGIIIMPLEALTSYMK